MKSFVTLATFVSLGVGSLAGTAAYLAAAEPAPAEVTVPSAEDTSGVVPGTRFEWAPCRRPAVLRHGACVTQVVRTIATPAPVDTPAPPVRPPSTRPPADDDREPEAEEPEAEGPEVDDDQADDDGSGDHEGWDDHEGDDADDAEDDGGYDD